MEQMQAVGLRTQSPRRSDWLRILALFIIVGFFVYRWVTIGGAFHAGMVVVFGLIALAGLAGLRPAFAGLRLGRMILPARWQALALNIAISLVFLDLVFGQIEWGETWTALAHANYWTLIPAFALVVVSLFLRTWRWQWLLRGIGRVPFGPAFRAANVGIGSNMVLPARAGEFLRAYVLGRATGYSKTAIFATLVVERIFDGLTILLSLVGVMLLGIQSPEIKALGLAGGAFYIAALGGMLLFYFREAWFTRLVERLLPPAWAARVLGLLRAFTGGLHILRDRRQLAMVALQSLLVWFAIIWSFYPILLAFNFGAPAPLFTPFLLTPLLALGLTVPGAPGGVGPMQAMATLALNLSFAAAGAHLAPDFAEQVAAFSLLMHFSQAFPEISLGAWAFLAEGLTWGEVKTSGEKEVGSKE